MKIHELAKGLEQLARLLRSMPNTEMEEFGKTMNPSPLTGNRDIAINLTTLAALSRLDKQEWTAFVMEYNLPIDIRPRDASRDVLGKMLKYLEANPHARKQLRERAQHRETEASPALMKALNILLNDDEREHP